MVGLWKTDLRIDLGEEERQELERLARSQVESHRAVVRAQTILLLAAGTPVSVVAPLMQTSAIFTLVNGVLLRPLPFPEQERLAFIGEWSELVPGMSISYPNLVDFRERQTSFSALGGARSQGFNYVGREESERLSGAMATHDVFAALGVKPLRGRLFIENDDRPGAEPTAVIGESLWRRQFGGRDDVINRQITLSGRPYTIIGVLPPGFYFGRDSGETVDVMVPLASTVRTYMVRLRAGVDPGLAEERITGAAQQVTSDLPADWTGVHLEGAHELYVAQLRPALLGITVARGLVLVELLGRQLAETDHAFWPPASRFPTRTSSNRQRLLGPKQLTDVYLLALAVKHGGDAEARHLVIVGS